MMWIVVLLLGCKPAYTTAEEACVAAMVARCECGEEPLNGYTDCVNAGERTDLWEGCEYYVVNGAEAFGIVEDRDVLEYWTCVADGYSACEGNPQNDCAS